MSDSYAVVTIYTASTGTVTVHTYGPHSLATARRVRDEIVKIMDVLDGARFRVNVCKLLVTDDVNSTVVMS